MGFWIVTGLLGVAIAAVLVLTVLRSRSGGVAPAAYDLRVYRDQLKEVDRDLARGVLSEEDATRARTEISRRVLDADRALQDQQAAASAGGALDRIAIPLGAALMLVLAFGIYLTVGAPGYPDLPLDTRISLIEQARADRPGQSDAEAQVLMRPRPDADPEREALVVQLRTVMERRPDDAQGLDLLAQNEAALGNFRAAHLAQSRLIAVLGEDATAVHKADLAEMMILAAGGYVSPEAEDALSRALQAAPQDGRSRYYIGLMYAQQGRPDLAYPVWRNLLADSTPDAPWLEPVRLQIEQVAALAGDRITLDQLAQPRAPTALRGPDSDQVEAAAAMSDEDRTAMIEGMVGNLAERLATEGGAAQEWARLIGAYQVLGRLEDARAVYDEARVVFAERASDLALIEQAGAGLDTAQ